MEFCHADNDWVKLIFNLDKTVNICIDKYTLFNIHCNMSYYELKGIVFEYYRKDKELPIKKIMEMFHVKKGAIFKTLSHLNERKKDSEFKVIYEDLIKSIKHLDSYGLLDKISLIIKHGYEKICPSITTQWSKEILVFLYRTKSNYPVQWIADNFKCSYHSVNGYVRKHHDKMRDPSKYSEYVEMYKILEKEFIQTTSHNYENPAIKEQMKIKLLAFGITTSSKISKLPGNLDNIELMETRQKAGIIFHEEFNKLMLELFGE